MSEPLIVLLNKPKGISSFQCCEKVRKILGYKKAGHSGILDFNVTGLLLTALGEATKLMPLFQHLDKAYKGVMHLHKDVSLDEIKENAKKFVGVIKQKPPKRSRIKRRVERERKIYKFEILGKKGKDVEFYVECEAGTYIRKLCHDFGLALGVNAHMAELCRVAINSFKLNEAATFEDLELGKKKGVLSIEKAAKRLKVRVLEVNDTGFERAKNGAKIFEEHLKHKIKIKETKSRYICLSYKGKIFCLGLLKGDDTGKIYIKPERVLNV